MSLGHRKLAVWYQQLARQLEAGLRFSDALRSSQGTGLPAAGLEAMAQRVDAGGSVEAAFEAAKRWLPLADRLVLSAAAEAGRMPSTLKNLAARHAQLGATKLRLALACLYPLAMLHAILLLVPVMRMIDWERGFNWDSIAYARTLAGTLGLGKLVVFYDDNNISIDGEVHGWFRDDTPARFEAYGWQVVRNVDGHNPHEIQTALATARKSADRPTLICCKTLIGFGSPGKQGKESSHGAPLGAEEITKTREKLGWTHGPFEIPAHIYAGYDARAKGAARQQAWNGVLAAYAKQFPAEAAEFQRRIKGELPGDWRGFADALIAAQAAGDKPLATRKSSKAVIEALTTKLPELFGGSADLGESNGTDFKGHAPLRLGKPAGNYINYGVREFAMSAAMNGQYLHGGFRPFGGTFLVFSDYARNAVRLSALMKLGVIYVYTHDSIALGEDGPTHQPVEHIASLRLIPYLQLWRPADAFETAVAWTQAIEHRGGPSLLVLTRQNLPPQAHGADHAASAARGGYVLLEPETAPRAVILATGSEVALAVDAAKALATQGVPVRVVSLPCVERFLAQDAAYRDSVVPRGIKRLAVEAGVSHYWRGLADDVVGIDTFGERRSAEAFRIDGGKRRRPDPGIGGITIALYRGAVSVSSPRSRKIDPCCPASRHPDTIRHPSAQKACFCRTLFRSVQPSCRSPFLIWSFT